MCRWNVLRTRLRRNKKAVSPVITSIILVFSVLIVGVTIWWFAIARTGATSAMYASEVGEAIHTIEERFVVEHILIEGTGPYTMTMWIHNYGKIDIRITAIRTESEQYVRSVDILIGEMEQILPIEELTTIPQYVQVESARGTVVIGFP